MLTKEQTDFLVVLKQSMGIVSIALQQTGLDREMYEEWKDNIFFNDKLKMIKETSIDFVENKLMNEIKDGNVSAITFYLKTIGKDRGYS
jgi:hypothetical protein